MTDNTKSQHPLRRLKSSSIICRNGIAIGIARRASGSFFADRVDYLDPARWDSVPANGSVLPSTPGAGAELGAAGFARRNPSRRSARAQSLQMSPMEFRHYDFR